MNWKEFLKLSPEKFALTIFLMIIIVHFAFSIPRAPIICGTLSEQKYYSSPSEIPRGTECNYEYGFPFASSYEHQIGKNSASMYEGGFVLNLLVWFVVAHIFTSTIWIFRKVKRK